MGALRRSVMVQARTLAAQSGATVDLGVLIANVLLAKTTEPQTKSCLTGRVHGARTGAVVLSSPSRSLAESQESATLTATSSAAASGDTAEETKNTAAAQSVSIMPKSDFIINYSFVKAQAKGK